MSQFYDMNKTRLADRSAELEAYMTTAYVPVMAEGYPALADDPVVNRRLMEAMGATIVVSTSSGEAEPIGHLRVSGIATVLMSDSFAGSSPEAAARLVTYLVHRSYMAQTNYASPDVAMAAVAKIEASGPLRRADTHDPRLAVQSFAHLTMVLMLLDRCQTALPDTDDTRQLVSTLSAAKMFTVGEDGQRQYRANYLCDLEDWLVAHA